MSSVGAASIRFAVDLDPFWMGLFVGEPEDISKGDAFFQ